MVAPVIIEFGTDEQKARYLPKIHSGEEFWCQALRARVPDRTSRRCRRARNAMVRYIRDQRHEDVDHRGAVGGLDLRARAYEQREEETGRDLVHPRRHDDARRHRAADRDDRRRPRDQRGAPRERRRAGRQPRRRRRRGMEHMPSSLLEHERSGHGGNRRLPSAARSAARDARARSDRRPPPQRADRAGRDRARSARVHRAAHAGCRVGPQAPRARVVDPQDQRHRDRAGDQRARARRARAVRRVARAPKYSTTARRRSTPAPTISRRTSSPAHPGNYKGKDDGFHAFTRAASHQGQRRALRRGSRRRRSLADVRRAGLARAGRARRSRAASADRSRRCC